MTRRAAGRSSKALTLNQYIHRATLGLPKAERLDAAAELRTHLLERVAKLEQKGFAREEAEFLAVQAMGNPAPMNRGVLGWSLPRTLGWAVLGLMSLATGSWWVYNNLMPPREGINVTGSNLKPDDMAVLWYNPDAPLGIDANYYSAVLTYPKATRTIYYAYITPDRVMIKSNVLSTVNEYDVSKRWPGSYRYQERWLVAGQESSNACPQDWNLFSSVLAINSPLSYADGSAGNPPNLNLEQTGPGISVCTGMKHLPDTPTASSEIRVITGGVLVSSQNGTPYRPLSLDRWTILQQLLITSQKSSSTSRPAMPNLPPNFKNTGLYLAVLPSDQAAPLSDSSAVFKRGPNGSVTALSYGGQTLPDLPALDWATFMRNLREMPQP